MISVGNTYMYVSLLYFTLYLCRYEPLRPAEGGGSLHLLQGAILL